jgi:hypothetical protein
VVIAPKAAEVLDKAQARAEKKAADKATREASKVQAREAIVAARAQQHTARETRKTHTANTKALKQAARETRTAQIAEERARKAEERARKAAEPQVVKIWTMDERVQALKDLVAEGDAAILQALLERRISLRDTGQRVLAPTRVFTAEQRASLSARLEAGEDPQALAQEAGVSLTSIQDLKRPRKGGLYVKKVS